MSVGVSSGRSAAPAAAVELPAPLERRFEAIVFDWDGTAVPDRDADASRARELIERLCACGVDVVVVSGTHVGNVDGQLMARPNGPGRLLMALNRGSEVFEVGPDGPVVIDRREATPEEEAALDRAADLTVARLAEWGLETEIVSQRLNRRKIDLIPLAEWEDPPKARIDELLVAVEARIHAAGFAGLPGVVDLAYLAAREAGVKAPRVTSDAKHVEIGLTDKADSARFVFGDLWRRGVAPDLVLVAGDEVGPLGGMPGSDSLMLVPESAAATVLSVGVEPKGVPEGVLHLPGGPDVFLAVLADQVRRRAQRDVPSAGEIPGWSFVVEGVDPDRERSQESLLTLADGFVGTSGAPVLFHPAATPTVLVAGAYDGEGPETDLMHAPRWDRLADAVARGDTLRRVLDLRGGLLGEEVVGPEGCVKALRFCSLARPGSAVLRVHGDGRPLAESPALVPPFRGRATEGRSGTAVWMSVSGSRASVTAAAIEQHDGGLPAVDRFAAYHRGAPGDPPDEALAKVVAAESLGFDRLLAEHRAAWASRWESADVVIDGDDELQVATRLALFHLMASVGSEGEAAVGARGLTGHAYRGHVFWDADTFILPFLAATHPPAARAMLEYRVRRLGAARRAAAETGYAGARFPWESADVGDDVTPTTGRDRTGRAVPIRTGEDEVHITAQVAWAAACYIDWTGDTDFASGPGCELLAETARFWASRIRLDTDGSGHLYGVIGPDEYHEPVDDNAFTNVMVRWNLRRAAALAACNESVSPAEVASWRDLADSLIDGYDPETWLYQQFAGFYDRESLVFAEVAPRRPITADLLLGRERVRGAQVVKQADVLMLHHLVPDEMAPGSLLPNLEYYEPRTAHGSSLSPGVHASLFARTGRMQEAVDALRLAAKIDLEDLTATGAGGLHLATMGSVWQALAYGFAGLRARADRLVIDPRLPIRWNGLEVRVCYRGARVHVRAEHDVVRVTADSPVTVDVGGSPEDIGPGTREFPTGVVAGVRRNDREG